MQVPSLTAERLSANGIIPHWVRHEHTARYEFAAQFVENNIVVDCACGTGQSTVHFVRAGARHIHAFDVSELSVREAREHCKSTAVTFEVRDALQLPLPDGPEQRRALVCGGEHRLEHVALEPDGERGGGHVAEQPSAHGEHPQLPLPAHGHGRREGLGREDLLHDGLRRQRRLLRRASCGAFEPAFANP